MSLIKGKNMRLYVDSGSGEKIYAATEFNVSHTSEMLEAFHKDSARFPERESDNSDVTISGSFLVDLTPGASTHNYESLYDSWYAGTSIDVIWRYTNVGDPEWSGTFFITSLDLTANEDGFAEGSYELAINGAPSKATQA